MQSAQQMLDCGMYMKVFTPVLRFCTSLLEKSARLASVCLVILMVLGMSRAPAWAAPEQPASDGPLLPPIRVGFSSFPPWRFETPDGEQGIETEFLQELARRMQVRLVFVHAPFVRNLCQMESGELDLMIGVQRRPERERYLLYVEPAYSDTIRIGFFTLREKAYSLRQYEDLRDMVIGVSNGVAYAPQFDADTSLTKYAVRSVHQNVDKLLKGRIDVFINEESTARYILQKRHLESRITMAPFCFEKDIRPHVVVSKRSPLAGRFEELSGHVGDMVREGFIKERYRAFFSHDGI